MPKIDWIIEILANGVHCAKCGKVENHFPDYICNAHTHGMAKYGHQDFQLVIHLAPEMMGYVLNSLGLRVQAGEQFKAGDMVKGILRIVLSDWMSLRKADGKCCGSLFPTAGTVSLKTPPVSILTATS